MKLKITITTLLAALTFGAAMADCKGACCKGADKFTMMAMEMAHNAAPIKGDKWSSDCGGKCCAKDVKGHKKSKKSKKSHGHKAHH